MAMCAAFLEESRMKFADPPSSTGNPGRTRISYYAAPEMATCAAFLEESRMKLADPTKLDRKSGASREPALSLPKGICSSPNPKLTSSE
jgi:hypothetical protein